MLTHKTLRLILSGLVVVALAVLVGCASNGQSKAVNSPHTLVRKIAVAKIGETCDPKDFETVVEILRSDPDRLVRSQAAFTLASYSRRYYSVGYAPLVDALENDPSVFVRAASARALSATKDSRAVAPLVGALRDDARGELELNTADKVIVYRACAADAARTSLEQIVGLEFGSNAAATDAARMQIASQWEDWYTPRAGLFPSQTALAKQ